MKTRYLKKILDRPSTANLIRFAILVRGRSPFTIKDLFGDYVAWGLPPITLAKFRNFFNSQIMRYGHAVRITDNPPHKFQATPRFFAALYPFREIFFKLGPDYRKEIEKALYENHIKPGKVDP